jgi:hypothetical protein
VHVLGADPQWLAARDQQLHAAAPREQPGHRRGGLGDLLEVVEHDEHLPLAQPVDELVLEGSVGRLADAQHATQREQCRVRVARPRQVHERDAIAVAAGDVMGDPDREGRLAGSTGTGEGQQAHAIVRQAPAELRALGIAADERGGLHRQPAGEVVERRQRREARLEARSHELEDLLRAADVLEPELAEVAQRGGLREAIRHQRGRRGGQEDLAAMRGGHQARGPIDRRAEEVILALLRLAGMHGHPDAERARRRPGLGGEGELGADTRLHRGCRGREHREGTVARGLDQPSAGVLDALAEDGIVARERGRHRGGLLLPQARAAGDVREQEREGTRGGRAAAPLRDRRAAALRDVVHAPHDTRAGIRASSARRASRDLRPR